MKAKGIIVLALLLVFLGYWAVSADEKTAEPSLANGALKIRELTFSGPFTHKNLTLYLIHGPSLAGDKKFLSLENALKQKKITVKETGTVNQLSVRNKSRNSHVFMQSGDIVRGGKQDRTIGRDYIIGPKSRNKNIQSFCVEQGRWQQRGGESVDAFSSSENSLPTAGLRLAARSRKSQSDVWKEVASTQDKLSKNLSGSVQSPASASSLELSLENDKVKEFTKEYYDALVKKTEGKKDVVGFVFAINGQLNSANVYVSNDLFAQLWPKLARACAVEAVAEQQKNTDDFKVPDQQAIKAFFQNAELGKPSRETLDKHCWSITRESKNSILFETYYSDVPAAIHKNYIRK